MKAFKRRARAFLRLDDGPTATEYAVLLAIISGATLVAMGMFGDRMNAIYLTLAASVADVF